MKGRFYLPNCPEWYVAARWPGFVMAQRERTGECWILTMSEFDELSEDEG